MIKILQRDIHRVAIVGAGTIGASWSAFFLAKGLEVVVSDPSPTAESYCRDYIAGVWDSLASLESHNLSLSELPLSFESDLEKALTQVDFVQENAPENLAFKQKLYAQMDSLLPPDVVIASSSSGLKMSEVQSQCQHPERCIIGHPFNPPHLIPLVEVVGGEKTSSEIVQAVRDFYALLGKAPVVLRKEVTGHIANRLQAALWREAAYLLQEGVASAQDIDLAVTQGPGLRWSIYGPLMTFHLGGGAGGLAAFLDHLGKPLESWCQDLGNIDTITPELKACLLAEVEQATEGKSIAELAAYRDVILRRLIELKQ